MPIFARTIPLQSLIFLKKSKVFPILLFSSISFNWSLKKAFFSLLAILWNSASKWVYLAFSSLPFTSFIFSAICKPSSESHFAFFHLFFLGTCQGTFNFKWSNVILFFVCCFSRTLFLIGSWKEQNCMQFSGLRKGTCLDSFQWLTSVTPFSDLLLKGNLFSYILLTQDMECFLALWRLLFAWVCFFLNVFTA